MAYDYVGTLRDFAGQLNDRFDRLFSRNALVGRVAIRLDQFDHLDERKGVKLVADACNANFAILGRMTAKTLQKVIAPSPLRESFPTMLEDVGATCAANFEVLQ